MTEWGGVIGFVVALISSILVCWLILHRAPRSMDTSGDREYDKLVISSILPSGGGISIDKVADTLKGQELKCFFLDEDHR